MRPAFRSVGNRPAPAAGHEQRGLDLKNARLIAERYAQALSEALRSEDEMTRVRQDLHRLLDLVERSADLRRAIRNPVVDPQAKLNILKTIAVRSAAHPRALRFLEVLAANDRLSLLDEAVAAVDRAFDRRLGIVEAEIRSAAPLDPALRERLAAALQRVAGQRVRIREHVDPDLLGGLVVQVGGTLFDGSIRTQLMEMKTRLTGQTVGAL